ncbi:MAG: peptidylprolyl isomerase [Elainellaceae cyanobacterium]
MISPASAELNSDRIVDFLKRQMQFREICQRILSQDIIDQAAQAHGVEVDVEDVQAEADRQRRQLQLENASDTYDWLAAQQVTPELWEAGIRDRLLAERLARHLFGPEVEAYFVEHRLEFDQVTLYQIVVPYDTLAQELFYRIEESEISFYEAAHLYDVDSARRLKCGYEGQYHRWALLPQVAAAVFSRDIGELVGPVKLEQGYALFFVEARSPAELTAEVRNLIVDRLFNAWLERELSAIDVN